jgi:hypothetical protein
MAFAPRKEICSLFFSLFVEIWEWGTCHQEYEALQSKGVLPKRRDFLLMPVTQRSDIAILITPGDLVGRCNCWGSHQTS